MPAPRSSDDECMFASINADELHVWTKKWMASLHFRVFNDLILLQLYACQSYPQVPSVASIRAVGMSICRSITVASAFAKLFEAIS